MHLEQNQLARTTRRKIGVFLAEGSSDPVGLLDALSSLFSVEFSVFDEADRADYDAALLFGVSREKAVAIAFGISRCMAFIRAQPVRAAEHPSEIHLNSTPYLAQCLRGRTLSDKAIEQISYLREEPGDEVVARRDNDILWIHRSQGNSSIDLVAIEPPELTPADYLFNYFQKDNWARLLPILHFLREVDGWEEPPLRACFILDDPNLHWRSYGYVKYDELAKDAQRHNYHVSFATVPMDNWYVHPETASLFRKNKQQLSLLIHGNNHTRFELTQVQTGRKRRALAVQALQRIARLEQLSGLKVARVMAAPHGACNYEMANTLLRAGFEAACISRSALMVRNPDAVWPISVGLNPAEFFGSGLPIIPRFNIRWDSTFAIFAAFLGQPIILVGHHDDLAGGPGLLEEWAGLINSLGNVQWTDMKSIARTNFSTFRDGDVLQVKTYSRRIRLNLAETCRQVCVQRVWLNGKDSETLIVQKPGAPYQTINSYQGEAVAVPPGEEVVIGSVYPNMLDTQKIPLSRPSLWTVARRQICEGRDRLRPTMDRLFASRNGK